MGAIQRIERRLDREKFRPTRLGTFIHPFYIVRSRLHRAIAAAVADVTGDVLDFGCGSKPYEPLFARARSYVGVDLAVSGHSHARSRVDHFYDGETLPFANDAFDAVVAFEVFEHVFNLDRILAEIGRVLRPGGRLVCTLPFAWDEHEQPHDFARYTSFGLNAILERAGFRVERMTKASGDVEAIGQLWAAYLHQHLAPRPAPLAALFQLLAVAPVTLATLALARLLPAPGQIYTSLVVRAAKPTADA